MRFLIWLVMGMIIVGCAPSVKKLSHIQLGMSKQQVVRQIGPPTVARGALTNKFGENIEVWEYTLALPNQDTAGQILGKTALTILTFGIGASEFKQETQDYWLYFVTNRLVRWG